MHKSEAEQIFKNLFHSWVFTNFKTVIYEFSIFGSLIQQPQFLIRQM